MARERVRVGDVLPPVTRMNNGDTLANLISGMGTDRDKQTSTFFGFAEMTQQQLEAAHRGDWIARKAVDIPAFDATREWRAWQADKDDITEIEATEKRFNVQTKVKGALMRGRLYGGGALILGVDQGNPEDELIYENVGLDDLKFVHVVSRYDLSAGPIEWDILSPYYGRPMYYSRSQQTTGSVKLHPSRVITFCGNEVMNPNTANAWGDSILLAVRDAIIGAGTVTGSVAQLVNEAKIDIIKIPGLSENIASDEYEQNLRKRFGTAATVKSLFAMLLVDKEEDWERIEANFTALPDVLKMYLMIASGAVDIPVTRFLGQSPAGLSATGESDTRNYYDRVATEQKTVLAPMLSPLDEVLVRSSLGTLPEGIFYNWNSLWQLSETEKADIATKKATVMTADTNAGLLSPLVLQKGRENQLIEDGTYPGLEQLIEEFGDDIDERDPQTDPNEDDPLDPDNDNNPDSELSQAEGEQASMRNKKPAKAGADPDGKTRAPAKGRIADRRNRERVRVADRAAARVRVRLDDATPRTAYVRRDVINGAEILKWAKSQGFTSTLNANELHVTIAYCKTPFNWLQVGNDAWGEDDTGGMTINAGGPRMMEAFDGGATVLVFASNPLGYRHRRIYEVAGVDSNHAEFNPHITLTYVGKPKDLSKVKPFQGTIKLGPEVWEEIKLDGSKDESYKTR